MKSECLGNQPSMAVCVCVCVLRAGRWRRGSLEKCALEFAPVKLSFRSWLCCLAVCHLDKWLVSLSLIFPMCR